MGPKVVGTPIPSVAEIESYKLPRRRGKRQTVDLALDMSTSCVGWVVGVNHKPIHHGKFILKKDAGIGHKLAAFDEFLASLLVAFTPDRLAVEKPVKRRGNTTERHMELMGIVRKTWVQYMGEELMESWIIPPTTVKRVLQVQPGANHEANKQIMVERINDLFDLGLKYHKSNKKISDDDIADAYAVLVTLWNSR